MVIGALLSPFNALQARVSGHIALYHSSFAEIPGNLGNLHNVHPETLHQQLRWLTKHFDAVTVDEWFARDAKARVGSFAVTFDDGYRCVAEEAAPVLIDCHVPATIFLVGCGLEQGVFWRDKVRVILEHKLEAEFLNFLEGRLEHYAALQAEGFYYHSKEPSVNSASLDKALDAFLAERHMPADSMHYTVQSVDDLLDHPLMHYGSHSYGHYVLSSLTDEEQEADLRRNHALLDTVLADKANRRSRIFSIPFGGLQHFNETTARVCQELGYTGLLLSRNRINFRHSVQEMGGLPVAERYMPPDGVSAFHRMLFRDGWMKPLARWVLGRA